MSKRTINIAINKATGEFFDAVKAFDNSDDRFLERKKYHEGRLELVCCECRQDLVVSSSKFKRIYLRHKPKYMVSM